MAHSEEAAIALLEKLASEGNEKAASLLRELKPAVQPASPAEVRILRRSMVYPPGRRGARWIYSYAAGDAAWTEHGTSLVTLRDWLRREHGTSVKIAETWK
jgi:hypothetical protein